MRHGKKKLMKGSEALRWSVPLLLSLACALPLPSTAVPNATPTPPSTAESPTPTPTEEPPALATLAGRVVMASAPPYLNDPILTGGLGVPVVVVGFNLDDGTYYWVDTTGTHPNYTLRVPAGRYHLAAYGHGLPSLPDLSYVAAGYTGMEPSCGQELVEIVIGAGEMRTGLDIADWNWSCSGTAYRPLKPDDVPVP